ncbi:hypothetical protein HG536_0D05700 [Torulaspora globosa]|uniref:XPG-I domain-containing protein n=1 Tax=Torulaspora globosa TaxID=48254 RepID=A0A7G3ZHR3_9SACH|nr:uncharacterized protein HG536_0D05700 [Torulaspora globosa]QLL33049.1 hypothetical protein HG536_0D05700 [Torulaspora globosa]
MGVPQIWELLQPYIKDKRVPFRKLAADFKEENGRPIRIAIDGYTWLFECGFITSPDSQERYHGDGKINKAIVNFLHRLKEFLSLDVSFIMVFDGNMKPWFKKNFREDATSISKELDEDFLVEWKRHERSHRERNYCLGHQPSDDLPEFMVVIKRTLDMMNISYIEACGEGEAQCAWLQKHGYVDYVLSNDSDTLIFGCDRMLRNYSKSTNDFGVTAAGSHRPNVSRDAKEPFVTIVELDAIRQSAVERYEWWSLLFFSVLLGADYNQGVKGLGKAKAAKLAQLEDPDFSMEFRSIFEPLDCSPSTRTSRYSRFQKEVLDYCSQNSVKLFGRNYKALLGGEKMEGWPSETAAMCYFHPYLIPNLDLGVFEDKFVNMSENASYKRIDLQKLRAFLEEINPVGVTHFEKWFWGLMQESFIHRYVLGLRGDTTDRAEISEEKTFFTQEAKFSYSCWKLRYNNFLHSFNDLHSRNVGQPLLRSPSPAKPTGAASKFQHSTWIPKQLLPEAHSLVKRYKEGARVRRKTSPRKTPRYSPQKNTLDEFLSNHSSPVKDIGSITSVSIPVLQPLKRRLFVETDHEEEADSDREANDSSLIILGESRLGDIDGAHNFSLDDELTQVPEDESPLKKQRLEESNSPRKT